MTNSYDYYAFFNPNFTSNCTVMAENIIKHLGGKSAVCKILLKWTHNKQKMSRHFNVNYLFIYYYLLLLLLFI
jgi:hypothetical protein